ncbi:MAG: response regulator, partial [Caldilineaceae bacterium]|nr:response regulator [Caldilineaceae bacterium]
MNNTLSQILIVDDNPDDLNLLAMQLRRANYIVLEAETGENCLTLLNQIKPDLILLDVIMPGISGFETCRRIKSIPNLVDIPVIFLTSLGDVEDKVKGFKVGGVDFLVKPSQKEELIARIENHLNLKRSKLEIAELNQQLEEHMQKRLVELHSESLWRRQYEQEVAKLLETVRHQGQQLGTLMQYCIDGQGAERFDMAKALMGLPRAYLNLLREHISLAHVHAEASQDKTASLLVTEHLSASVELLNSLEEHLERSAAKQLEEIDVPPKTPNALAKLSAREQEILRLIADGSSNSEIAQLLSLAEPTVRVYRSRIMGKLQLD